MGAVHNKIKRLRIQSDFTQEDMAEKMNIHLKTYQKIENGITKMDIDRLKQFAGIFETTLEDLINAEDGGDFYEVKDNDVGVANNQVTIHHGSDQEKVLYERLLEEKDKIIKAKDQEIIFLREQLQKVK